ncbi:MAG: hypothetical protein H7X93_05300, partial [Sphingomonadaceae bacterium]|nr:hypothetical protein [Sphingomonadaceae bacterium]
MTAPAPRFAQFAWDRGCEWLLSHGPIEGPQLLIVPPLFEELNRMRRLIGDVMRALAAQGVGSHLPDLPGTGESDRRIEETGWEDWLAAVPAAARFAGATHVASLRGGALVDHGAGLPLWRFQPAEGAALLRDMTRARALTDPGFDEAAKQALFEAGPTELGGYRVPPGLARALNEARPAVVEGARVVRLATDAKPA